jgi:predicted permease
MQAFWQDLRYGARILRKNYGFTVIAVLSLALGIGANTALFSIVDAVLLKKLPVKEPDRLVLFKSQVVRGFSHGGYNGNTQVDPATGMTTGTSFPYQTFMRLREQESVLSDIFVFAGISVNANVDGHADVARAQVVSGNYFAGLGVQPLIGRAIDESDDQPGASPVAVISHRYCVRRFDADETVLGKQIGVNNVSFTIVGVTPPGFDGAMQVGSSPDISVALAMEPQISPERSRMSGAGQWWLRLMGRLKPEATADEARAELEGVFQQSVVEHRAARQAAQAQSQSGRPIPSLEPADYPRLLVDSGSQGEMDTRRFYEPQLHLMLGVVGVLLLIACANVANLLLARATSRHKEIAVRLALGASRSRLVRQLLTESVLLAALGGLIGILFALWIKDGLLAVGLWGGQGMTALDPKLDLRVFGFTLGLSLVTGLLFGIAPALRSTRIDLTPALKESGRGSSGVSRSLLSKSLIVVQVALSLVLLIGAGLILRTLHNLQSVDVGFNRDNLLLFRVDPNLLGYRGERLASLYQQMFERIEAAPGVQSVTFTRNALLSGSISSRDFYAPGAAAAGPQQTSAGEIWVHHVRENYLEAMEIPILGGRGLRAQDDSRATRVVVVNQTFAERFFPGEDPVGKRFGFNPDNPTQIEIVGVARDSKYSNLREEIRPTIYVPWLQEIGAVGVMTFEVRTTGEPQSVVASIREAVREVDPNLPISDVKTQVEQIEQTLRMERLFARLLSFFGLLALLLASIGLYGVMSYSVAQRTQEIGIRMALGAQVKDVLRLVIGQGMLLAIIGVALGVGGAIGLTRLLKSWLYEVSATDTLTFVLISLLLAAVALLACAVPARRAAKVDPMTALRYE